MLKNKAWVWSATQSKQIFCMRKTRRLIAICSNYYYLMLLITIVLFVTSLFTLIFYANKLMREEIQRILTNQHLLSVSYPSTNSLQQHLLLAALLLSFFVGILIWWFIKQQFAPLQLVCSELLSNQIASGQRPFIKDDISEFILGFNNRLDNYPLKLIKL